MVKVERDEDAKLRFLGSPTIRANAIDPSASESGEYGLSCRVYRIDGKILSYPLKRMIERPSERNVGRPGYRDCGLLVPYLSKCQETLRGLLNNSPSQTLAPSYLKPTVIES